MRRRAIAGFALFGLWLGLLALYLAGNSYCFDAASGRQGIDALGSCASHHPLGLPIVLSDELALSSLLLVPAMLVALWWPFRRRFN